ncbi:PREDICTED: protein-L-isoaspartate O-methyltransferase 1-like isoform X2 [Tarenaya hassleriana]|uniref:protein-L-isoaspartate O-methyltransferase 1-like isoform X2 n=1 Tax=Tarenaya hassleriana TaxID=28532 RepID=UPI00053C4837|nr:PREDICTED: protein-L-isoaspartate O-methyltransferase 1-like isoform X2 [Tarenaya hassleriana]
MRAQVLPLTTLTAFCRRYCAPRACHFLTFARHHLHHRSSRCCTLSLSQSSHDNDLSRLLSGFHCPLFRMEHSVARGDSARNKAMVENLRRYGVIMSNRVAEVMEALDRGHFVPDDGSSAYVDTPLPIGYNATISAPHMHATCLQLLEDKLQPGMRALDVGSGTGYLTACFALMVGPEGRAVGVEHISELVDVSVKNISKSAVAPLLKKGSLSVHAGDGRKGWPNFAPYDAIHVGAAAAEIPQALLDQLKPGGRMVIPVGTYFQDLKVFDKNEDGSTSVHTETSVRYVPLTSRDEQLGGY